MRYLTLLLLLVCFKLHAQVGNVQYVNFGDNVVVSNAATVNSFTNGLLGAWSFDKAATNSADFGSNLTQSGSVFMTNGFTSNAVYSAVAANGYLYLPTNMNYNIRQVTTALTMTFMYKPDATPTGSRNLMLLGRGTSGFGIQTAAGGVISSFVATNASSLCSAPASGKPLGGAWTMLSIVLNATNLMTYSNAVLVASNFCPGSVYFSGASTEYLYLGWDSPSFGPLGACDNHTVWSRALSQAELLQFYTLTSAGKNYPWQ